MFLNKSIIFILIITALMSSACYREMDFPDAALPKEKMIDILADVHLAEAKVIDYTGWTQQARDSLLVVYYNTIFKMHKVKAADFDQSMNAYMKNPEALSKIYEKVLEKLQKDESVFVKKTKAPAPIKK